MARPMRAWVRSMSQATADAGNRHNPKRDNDLLMAGELFMQTGDVQQGLTYLQRAEAMKPSPHAELLMATAYMKLKQPDRARQLLESAKRRAPNDPDIYRAIANYYREVHDYGNAIATLKAIPRPTPEVLADLAYSYGLNGDKKQSAATYAQAAEAGPRQIGLQLSAAQANWWQEIRRERASSWRKPKRLTRTIIVSTRLKPRSRRARTETPKRSPNIEPQSTGFLPTAYLKARSFPSNCD